MRLATILLLLSLVGQASPFVPYEWDKNRSRFTLTSTEQALTELVLKNHMEYTFGFENDQFLMQSVVHRIILINGSQAIQNHNRISVPMSKVIELIDLKARAISKDGKVTYFDTNNLKELKEEESGNAYRIFAIEGIEAGSEVEYYYVRKMAPSFSDRLFYQWSIPTRQASFMLRCPKHLVFDTRSYNGFPKVDTASTAEFNTYSAVANNIAGLKKETFSFIDPNRMRVEFKLAYNRARSKARINTWDDAAKTFFDRLHERDKDAIKALARFLEKAPKPKGADKAKDIRAIEDYVKSTIATNEENTDERLAVLSAILKDKVASKEGITRLFVAIYEELKIPVELVITCSRESVLFDGTFDSWNYLDDYFLHFPEAGGYLSPHDPETRYPLIAAQYTAQQGLFIETLDIGGMKSGLASIREIPAAEYKLNADNLAIDVRFNLAHDSSLIKMRRVFMGLNAGFVTPYYHLMTKDQLHAMVENITRQTAPDAVFRSWIAEPVTTEAVTAFLVDVNIASQHFLQFAGSNLLFKIGELIGPQTELYEDKERMTDVENDFNRGYDRTITIHLPQGYRVRNASDLKFDVTCKDGNDVPFLFQSSVTQQGDVLTVTIQEYYKKIRVPKTRYEEFRKVINAAADFNKVTLVLEKVK